MPSLKMSLARSGDGTWWPNWRFAKEPSHDVPICRAGGRSGLRRVTRVFFMPGGFTAGLTEPTCRGGPWISSMVGAACATIARLPQCVLPSKTYWPGLVLAPGTFSTISLRLIKATGMIRDHRFHKVARAVRGKFPLNGQRDQRLSTALWSGMLRSSLLCTVLINRLRFLAGHFISLLLRGVQDH